MDTQYFVQHKHKHKRRKFAGITYCLHNMFALILSCNVRGLFKVWDFNDIKNNGFPNLICLSTSAWLYDWKVTQTFNYQCRDEIVTSLVVVHRHVGGSQDLGQGLLPQGGVKLARVPPEQNKALIILRLQRQLSVVT